MSGEPGAGDILQLRTEGVDDTRRLAAAVARLAQEGDVVLLAGQMGAGKTAFAQGFARGLGVAERVVSPTFTLVREYSARLRLHHVDVYRLEHLQEVLDLGLAELLDDRGVTLVEWGDAVLGAMPNEHLEVKLEMVDDEVRDIEVAWWGPSWTERGDTLRSALHHWAKT